jgi:predicted ArsR family transcriptional regulator
MLRVRKRKLKLGTDIDKLYEILKERKKISFKAISRAFKVSDETVRKWGTTLESGNLARVEYPSIGYPELVIKGK